LIKREYEEESKKPPNGVGTVVCIKVDRVDSRKLDPHSVPRVVCEVTEHNNYTFLAMVEY
jgi:hypothetical protein